MPRAQSPAGTAAQAPQDTQPAPRAQASLAGRLTRMLIFWVGSVWLLCVLGVVWYVDREISFNFDNELVEVSHRMFDIAMEHYDALSHGQEPAAPLVAPPPLFIEDEVIYQVVGADRRTLLRSSNAQPRIFDIPLAPGFHNTAHWRVYTVRHPTREVFMQVADPIHERRRAVNRTLFGLIVPMVAVLPLLALMLRQIGRRELRALQHLAGEIAQRGGSDLRSIPVDGLPQELRSVGDDVNRLLDRLSHALDVERALAANAAHELRTPLAATRLRLQTALDHGLSRTDVQAALAALQTLSQRTEKLLQLSRAESGASLARRPVDLAWLGGMMAEEFWKEKRVTARLSLQLPQQPPAQALGDVDALAIALRNLVENALRYAGDAPVVLELAAPCTLVVRDTGPGVPAEQLQTLRQRHVRHGEDRTGYGLGLSIVATIAQQHGARLELASPPAGAAQGFEARIVLPPAGGADAARPLRKTAP